MVEFGQHLTLWPLRSCADRSAGRFPEIGSLLQRYLDHAVVILDEEKALPHQRAGGLLYDSHVFALARVALLDRQARIGDREPFGLGVGEWNELPQLLADVWRRAAEFLFDEPPACERAERRLQIRQPDATKVVAIGVNLGDKGRVSPPLRLRRHFGEVEFEVRVHGLRVELHGRQFWPALVG